MGNFKQHTTCSTLVGIAIGGVAYQFGFSMPTCLLSAGLCSMAGMLPDIDSDSSRSFQECIYLAAGLCAVLLVDRLRMFSIDRDIIMLSGAAMFLFVRFVVGGTIKKITVHRGMLHSIPAAVLSGQIIFFLSTGTTEERIFKGFAITAGFLSHLILDEIFSIDSTGKQLRLKKSFGTALKFYDSKHMSTVFGLYGIVLFLGFWSVKDPEILGQFDAFEQRFLAEMEDSNISKEELESVLSHVKHGTPLNLSPRRSSHRKAIGTEQTNVQTTAVAQSISSIPNSLSDDAGSQAAVPYAGSVVSQNRRNSEHHFFSKLRSDRRSDIPIAIPHDDNSSADSAQYQPAQNRSVRPLVALDTPIPSTVPTSIGIPNDPRPVSIPLPTEQTWHQTIGSVSQSETGASVPLPFDLPPEIRQSGFQQTSLRTEIDSYIPPFLPQPIVPRTSTPTRTYNDHYNGQNVDNYAVRDVMASDARGGSVIPGNKTFPLSGNDFSPRTKHQPGDMNRGPARLQFPPNPESMPPGE